MARSTPSARWVDAPVHSLYSSWGDYRAETFDRGPQRLKDISTVWTNEKEEKKKERRRRCWCWWLNRYPSWQPFLAHFIPNAHRIAYGSINDRILCPGCCPCSSGFKGNGREWKKAVHFCHVNLIYPYSFEYIYIYYRYIIWLPAHALLNSLASCWKERKKRYLLFIPLLRSNSSSPRRCSPHFCEDPFFFRFFLVILFRFPCGIDWPAFQITRYWRLVRHLLVLKKSQFFIIVIQ